LGKIIKIILNTIKNGKSKGGRKSLVWRLNLKENSIILTQTPFHTTKRK
jgi:hypothetical protein